MATAPALRRGDILRTPSGREVMLLDFMDKGRLRLAYLDDNEEVDLPAGLVRYVRRPMKEGAERRERVKSALPGTMHSLAEATGMHRHSVRRCLVELADMGLVICVPCAEKAYTGRRAMEFRLK